jgi:hypothetical protein
MSGTVSTVYRGVTIEYCEWQNKWRNEANEKYYDSLAKAKEAVNGIINVCKKMTPVPVVQKEANCIGGGSYIHSEITGFISEQLVWVRRAGTKDRSLCLDTGFKDRIFAETGENWEKIDRINSLKKQIAVIEKDVGKLESELETVNVAELYRKRVEELKSLMVELPESEGGENDSAMVRH